MFGQRIDEQITMLQRVVALLRDLILGITLGLTCLIVYFGADSESLTILDWTKLVGAAFSIIIAPVFVFFTLKVLINLIGVIASPIDYLLGPTTNLPRGGFAWFVLKLPRMNRRRYVEFMHKLKQQVNPASKVQTVMFSILKAERWLGKFLNRWYPHVAALLSFVLAILIFRRTIRSYIP